MKLPEEPGPGIWIIGEYTSAEWIQPDSIMCPNLYVCVRDGKLFVAVDVSMRDR